MTFQLGLTKASGTIAAGATAQTALATNDHRLFLLIQNPSTQVESLFVAFGVTATGTGADLELEPGAAVVFDVAVPSQLVSVIAATTAHAYVIYWG